MNLSIVCAALLMLAVHQTAAQNLVIMPTGSVLKPIGGSTTFTCTATSVALDHDPQLRWFNVDGQEIRHTGGGYRKTIARDSKEKLKLVIINIEQEDQGEYRCTGNVAGRDQEMNVVLNLKQDIKFVDAPTPQNPEQYTNALIKCVASGSPNPEISWYFKGNLINTGGRYRQENDGMRILNITKADNGVYTCQAEVAQHGDLKRQDIDVRVSIKPVITSGPGVLKRYEGQMAEIGCLATATPSAKYEFFKDESQNAITTSPDFDVDEVKGTLVIKRTNHRRDNGSYTCRAWNKIGEDFQTGSLAVIVLPKYTRFNNITANIGLGASLECIVDAYPRPEMKFRKVGNEDYYTDDPTQRIYVERNPQNSLTLKFKDVSPSDTGNYTCEANNDPANIKFKNGTLRVLFPPNFDDQPYNEFYVFQGRQRNLTCIVNAGPRPNIAFYKQSIDRDGQVGPMQQIVSNETFRIYELPILREVQQYEFRMQIRVTPENRWWLFKGLYSCNATNPHGSKGHIINIKEATIPGPPRTVSTLSVRTTTVELEVTEPENNGGMIILGYTVEYGEAVNKQSFDKGDRILIEDLTPSQSYQFRVRARNDVGEGEVKILPVTTQAIQRPYPLKITSKKFGRHAYKYHMTWARPDDGGREIKTFSIKYKRVEVANDNRTVLKSLENARTSSYVNDGGSDNPRRFADVENLYPMAWYEADVSATNSEGESVPTKHLFRTAEGDNVGGVIGESTSLKVSISVLLAAALLALL